jgi:hypothetical protein
MSSNITRAFARSLILVPLALVHLGAATAADSPERVTQQQATAQHGARTPKATPDAQESARELLLGGRAAAPNAQHSGSVAKVRGDAQESARQLLLGATTRTTVPTSPEVPRVKGTRIHGDAQMYAQQLLLGRPDTAAGRL